MLYKLKRKPPVKFNGSLTYWEQRYATGGNSGPGSYGRLADFKAYIVNSFVKEKNIKSVIEFGCGDGNQLSLAVYPKYIGLDVSPTIVKLCKDKFRNDSSKSFFLYDPFCFIDNHSIFQSDLGLSMDVIFHLVEDDVFHEYMQALFGSAKKYVIIYSSNRDDRQLSYVKERNFTPWISRYMPKWHLIDTIRNKYPYDHKKDVRETSFSDFYIFQRK